MNKNKKILLGVGSIATVIAPIATVVACGSSSSSVKISDDKSYAKTLASIPESNWQFKDDHNYQHNKIFAQQKSNGYHYQAQIKFAIVGDLAKSIINPNGNDVVSYLNEKFGNELAKLLEENLEPNGVKKKKPGHIGSYKVDKNHQKDDVVYFSIGVTEKQIENGSSFKATVKTMINKLKNYK